MMALSPSRPALLRQWRRVGEQVGQISLDQLGDRGHRLETAVGRAPVPAREERELERARSALKGFKDRYQIVMLEKGDVNSDHRVIRRRDGFGEPEKGQPSCPGGYQGVARTADTQSELAKSSTTVASNPLAKDLKSELPNLEIELASLSQLLSRAHPRIIALAPSIAHAKKRLEEEVSRMLSDDTSKINTVYLRLLQDRFQAEATLESLRANEQALAATVKRPPHGRTDLRRFARP
jgi:capsule polysaccharide export protein KpsE/RkpR